MIQIITNFLSTVPCLEDEFSCDENQCFSYARRCDGVRDCRDDTDEQGCPPPPPPPTPSTTTSTTTESPPPQTPPIIPQTPPTPAPIPPSECFLKFYLIYCTMEYLRCTTFSFFLDQFQGTQMSHGDREKNVFFWDVLSESVAVSLDFIFLKDYYT